MYHIGVAIDVHVIHEAVCLTVEICSVEDAMIRGRFTSVWLVDLGIIISKSMSQ